MGWKPNRWGAAALGLLAPTLGLLYVGLWRWAIPWAGMRALSFLAFLLGWVPKWWGIAILISPPVLLAFFLYRLANAAPALERRPVSTGKAFLLGAYLGIYLVTVVFRTHLLEPFRIRSTSMEPALVRDALVVAEKGAIAGKVARGDIILFAYPKDPSTTYIMRVVGMPGDRLAIRHSRIAINGVAAPLRAKGDYTIPDRLLTLKAFEETIGSRSHTVLLDEGRHHRPDANPHCSVDQDEAMHCLVPAGHYFVMGDNRDNANDSRFWGMVAEPAVVGKLGRIIQ